MRAPRRARWFGHPVIVAGMALFVCGDLLVLGSQRDVSTPVADAVWGLLPHPYGCRFIPSLPGEMYQAPDGSLHYVMQVDAEPEPVPASWSERYVRFSMPPAVSHGWFHPTRCETRVLVHGDPPLTATTARGAADALLAMAEALPEEDRTWMASTFAEELLALQDPTPTSSTGLFAFTHSRPVPTGHLRDTIALAALAWVAAGFAFGGTLGTARTWWRPLAARQPGICPGCKYDMRGLERCPECGWTAKPYANTAAPENEP